MAYPVFLARRRLHRAQRPGHLLRAEVRADLREARGEGRAAAADHGADGHQPLHAGYWWLVSSAWSAALVFAFRRWASTEAGRLRARRACGCACRQAGTIYLNLALSRFTRILGTLLHNGIPILQSLRIAKDSTGNRVLTEAIDKAAENITAGDTLASPLAACQSLPARRRGDGGRRRGKQQPGKGADRHRRQPGETHHPAAGAVRAPAGAGHAAGHGRRDAAWSSPACCCRCSRWARQSNRPPRSGRGRWGYSSVFNGLRRYTDRCAGVPPRRNCHDRDTALLCRGALPAAAAFTLMEVMVVVAILVILAGGRQRRDRSATSTTPSENAASSSITSIENRHPTTRLNHGSSPPTSRSLTQPETAPSRPTSKRRTSWIPWGTALSL